MGRRLGHAVVIGAGIAGLSASAAAARHFAQVTLLDRDALPSGPDWRRGVPQARHVHALLNGGQDVLADLFPGLGEGLRAAGSVSVDIGREIAWHHFGGWKARFDSGVRMLCQTRGFLEWQLRARLMQLPNLNLRDHAQVVALLGSARQVEGVALQDGNELRADLVVDASGRNSQTPAHLAALGADAPPRTELPVDIAYASRIYRPPPGQPEWTGLLIHSRPPQTRTAALMPIEGGRWIVTLVGWGGDTPGSEPQAFLDWARGLPTPVLYEAIRHAEPLERVWRWNFASNLRRHYDALRALPDGLVVMGDAHASLNPIYAQGMSQAAVGGGLLDRSLRAANGRAPLAGLGRRFHRQYARFVDRCWMTSTTEDFGELGAASGGRAWYAPLMSRYLHRFTQLTWRDRAAALAFFQVMHLQRGPTSLLHPRFLLPALLASPAPAASLPAMPRPTVADPLQG